eukprot:jgi/Botrbrau1/3092/Bobra.0070s0078.1
MGRDGTGMGVGPFLPQLTGPEWGSTITPPFLATPHPSQLVKSHPHPFPVPLSRPIPDREPRAGWGSTHSGPERAVDVGAGWNQLLRGRGFGTSPIPVPSPPIP